jgi:acetyl/propionyl-CoA carboxylase alpha subunit
MVKAGIPVIPGSDGAVDDETRALRIIDKIGLPVLIKAAGGGGGKGMRIVRDKSDLVSAMKQAVGEARSAFGNPTIFIEKLLDQPRHIEFQILADNQGNVVHLCERECSIQRRHQKLIEEAPSAVMTPELRERMGEAARKAVKASGYNNAGTVEFMVDKGGSFFFLEMNTRLQVEHPVTELVTGIDIVKEQFKIAAGEKLSLRQEDIKINGAAIECRITAEDPENGFAPCTGKISRLAEPGGPGVRVETGIYEDFEVPIYYDPLVAKLLVWAPNRQEAIARMQRALSEYTIQGIKTAIPFHLSVMENEKFVAGDYDTSFLDRCAGELKYRKRNYEIAAIAAVLMKEIKAATITAGPEKKTASQWKTAARQSGLRKD